jgi:protochlorophyllide reductase
MVRLVAVAAILASSVAFAGAFTSAMESPTRVALSASGSALFKAQFSPISSTALKSSNTFTQEEMPEKLYFKREKELPKVLGGIKIGLRKLVVITGASSGLGLNCAATLAKSGKYFVVMAVRDVEKGKQSKPYDSRQKFESHAI